MKIILILCCFLQLMASCNDGESRYHKEKNDLDTVVRDIPRDRKGNYIRPYLSVSKIADELNIGKLDSGFDSIQIRLWYSYHFIDTAQLVIIKKIENNWEAQLYTYRFNRDKVKPGEDYMVISNQRDKSPKSGWNSFVKDLYELKVKELPDMSTIPGNNFDMSDPDVFVVEIATKKNYRLYTYQNPYYFRDRWWQAKNMNDIMQLIEAEFNFNRIVRPR